MFQVFTLVEIEDPATGEPEAYVEVFSYSI
jgi:hypothetical protein